MTLLKGLALGLYGEPKSGKTRSLVRALADAGEPTLWIDNDSNEKFIDSLLEANLYFDIRYVPGVATRNHFGELDIPKLERAISTFSVGTVVVDPIYVAEDTPRLQQFAKDNNVLVIYVVNTK